MFSLPFDSAPRFPKVILATACLPWKADWSLDEDCFQRQVHFLARHFTRYLYIFGTAGEGYAVNREQFEGVVRHFQSACSEAGVHPMIGLISLSLSEIQHRIEFCRQRDLNSFQVSLPSWGTLTDREVELFFEETCGRYPEATFLHYNLPRVGRRLEPEHYQSLSERFSNLVAVKHTVEDPERMRQYVEAAPALRFFAGGKLFCQMRDLLDLGLLPSLDLANMEKTKAIFEGADFNLEDHLEELAQVGKAVHASADQVGAHIDGSFDKQLIKVHDPEFPLRLLPPYTYCSEEDFKVFLEMLPEGWGGMVNG